MKRFIKYRPIQLGAFLGVFMLSLAACELDNGDEAYFEELGVDGKTYTLSSDAGDLDIKVYSNQNYNITLENNANEWIAIAESHLSGDGTLHVEYDFNDGFPRMAKICLNADGSNLSDTIYLKQKGVKTPTFKLSKPNMTVHGYGGEVKAELDMNIDIKDLTIRVDYTDEETTSTLSDNENNWVKDITYENGFLVIQTDPNPDERAIRTATVNMVYIDGWEEEIKQQLFLMQANAKDELGVEVSFMDVRNSGDVDGVTVTDDIYITGYVVSDRYSGNTGDNTQTTQNTIDYSISQKTAYVESIDGRYGFCIETPTAEDNIFSRYSKVQILLKGTKVTLEENPERYTISGVTASMVMSSTEGTAADLPVKEKHMKDLTDEDIYTYVTLKDCELPVRKGSLTPINEGYANSANAHRCAKYATLMRDINGNSMYIYTNTTCPYRRDGSRLPYGSGNMSGVIVYELFTRFEYMEGTSGLIDEEKAGEIGRYQIRHMSKSDFKMADDFKNSFSGLITEFRYIDTKGIRKEDGSIPSTYGDNGRLRHTYTKHQIGNGLRGNGINDYAYLGPIGSSTAASNIFGIHKGNENGFGIILEDGTDYLKNYANVNTDGKGNVDGNAWLAWSNPYWWDEEHNRGYAWVINFSTQNITSNHLSMQLSVSNQGGTAVSKPRFWKAEWSFSGDMDNDNDWHYITSYTIPDMVVWANTLISQCPGYKAIDVELPLNLLGKENVYIRLMPENNKASNGSSWIDAGATISVKGNAHSSMNYFAIRYNK